MEHDIEQYTEQFYSGKSDVFERENLWIKKILKEDFSYRKNSVWLDFGCGSGYWLETFSQLADIIYATDVNPEAIDYCKKIYAVNNINFSLFNGKTINIERESVDVITVFWVLQEVLSDENLVKIFDEFKRVLKPKGKIFIVENIYSDVRFLTKSSIYGDMLLNQEGEIIRQFKENTIYPILSQIGFSFLGKGMYELSFYEIYEKM